VPRGGLRLVDERRRREDEVGAGELLELLAGALVAALRSVSRSPSSKASGKL
jgi:hypothetical protein